MDRKYKGWSMQERYCEYARLKQEWENTNRFNEKEYDKFIDQITKQLGI